MNVPATPDRQLDFRDATIEDVPAIYGLILKGYPKPISKIQIKMYLASIRVGVMDNKIVTCHMSGSAGSLVTIQRFAVLPDYRRGHIGVHTMVDLLTAAFDKGKLSVVVVVPEANVIGQLFLRAVTFTATSVSSAGIRFERKLYDVLES